MNSEFFNKDIGDVICRRTLRCILMGHFLSIHICNVAKWLTVPIQSSFVISCVVKSDLWRNQSTLRQCKTIFLVLTLRCPRLELNVGYNLSFLEYQHWMLKVFQYCVKYWIDPEDDHCNVYRKVGKYSKLHDFNYRWSKFYSLNAFYLCCGNKALQLMLSWPWQDTDQSLTSNRNEYCHSDSCRPAEICFEK